MAFEDILWAQGQDNAGGLVGHAFFVPLEDVDTDTLPTLNADGVTVDDAVVLKANKKWFKIYFTRGTGKIDANVVGERDGKSFENMFEFKYPGETKEVVGFERQVKNTPCLFLARDAQGNYRVLGLTVTKDPATGNDVLTYDFPAYIEAINTTTGAQAADAKGHTFQVKAEANVSPLFYEGTVDVDDAT